MAIGVLIKRVISHGEDAKVLLPQQWLCLCYLLYIPTATTLKTIDILELYLKYE
jgi:hypothetical protein